MPYRVVRHLTVRSTNISGNVSVEGSSYEMVLPEIDSDDWHGAQRLPGGFEILVDEVSDRSV